jgi:SAM-dependent methyltransferase
MIDGAADDPSNGYDAIADDFIRGRLPGGAGASTVREWASQLPANGDVLDVGCGHGATISQALFDEGLEVFGIDASPRMLEEYRARFPNARVACESVEESSFFDRMFDGVVAWGLMFLLPASTQLSLIDKMAAAVSCGRRLLFTSPRQACSWHDLKTDRLSISLGADAYRAALRSAGMSIVNEMEDEGNNYYYDSVKM